MCSHCAGDYQDPGVTTEEAEFSDVGRAPWNVKLVAVWGVILGASGFVLGFSLEWIYPVVDRLILKVLR
jgi:hypothetical protein